MMLADKASLMNSRIAILCLANLVLAGYFTYLAWQLFQLQQGLRRWRLEMDAMRRAGESLLSSALLALKQTELGSLTWRQQGRSLQRQLIQMRQLLGLLAFWASFWQQTRQPRRR